ncbi:DUF6858 family protein [Halorhodospira halophila]|uniref:Uncharacterized protein n=1 Tax=Halorhodospira halophila (strain DSM 244 / SL1) TaxID=349124 RepID=A1WTH8_HALHL|nr:hypothetical protein [Halorhodospira halophila]ABM60990.1 conserved hypothetical protein [Halorhodospira halophila SL1]MBK1730001.1 hypothetical protein [Halorhodospira halophila]
MSELSLTWLQDAYPIRSLELPKGAPGLSSADDLLAKLRSRVEADERVAYIATFDHYEHTASLPDGEIAAGIHDAKNLVFCVGRRLPMALAPAVRPRSIGVVTLDDRFVVSFMESPMPLANEIMTQWLHELAEEVKAEA